MVRKYPDDVIFVTVLGAQVLRAPVGRRVPGSNPDRFSTTSAAEAAPIFFSWAGLDSTTFVFFASGSTSSPYF